MRLFIRQFGLCHWCTVPMSTCELHRGGNSNVYATLDHIIKREDGGTLHHKNIVLAHGRCNSARHSPIKFAHRVARMRKVAPMIAQELGFVP